MRSFWTAPSTNGRAARNLSAAFCPRPRAETNAPAPWQTGDVVFHNPEKPVNNSPNNTGIKELPPAQPAFIGYTHGQSARFPVLNAGGGRTAFACSAALEVVALVLAWFFRRGK